MENCGINLGLGLGLLFKFAHKFTSLNCHNITIKF